MIKFIYCIVFVSALGSMAVCIASEQPRQAKVRTFPSEPASHYTDISSAASKGDLNAVQQFIQQGADLRSANRNGYTILHTAAHSGNINLVFYLVENGAFPLAVKRYENSKRQNKYP